MLWLMVCYITKKMYIKNISKNDVYRKCVIPILIWLTIESCIICKVIIIKLLDNN